MTFEQWFAKKQHQFDLDDLNANTVKILMENAWGSGRKEERDEANK